MTARAPGTPASGIHTWAACVDCPAPTLVVTGRREVARCGPCMRAHHGATVTHVPDGRPRRVAQPGGPTRRPPGRGLGVEGPACPERATLSQGYDGPPVQAMCIRCGRVTARRDTDSMPWCGGNMAEQPNGGGGDDQRCNQRQVGKADTAGVGEGREAA